jgi:hypothetical protein
LFLLGDGTSMISGVSLPIDSGYTCRQRPAARRRIKDCAAGHSIVVAAQACL